MVALSAQILSMYIPLLPDFTLLRHFFFKKGKIFIQFTGYFLFGIGIWIRTLENLRFVHYVFVVREVTQHKTAFFYEKDFFSHAIIQFYTLK